MPSANPTVASGTSAAQPVDLATNIQNSAYFFLDNMDQGKYLLVQTYESGIPSFKFISIDGRVAKSVAEDGFFWSTSNDGSSVLMIQPTSKDAQYVDITTKRQSDLRVNKKCYAASWSTDSSFIVMACENSGAIDLYILNSATETMTRLTDCLEKDLDCGSPSWSPDGQWIAYVRNEVKSGPPSPKNGVYVFNTDCIKDNNCMSKQIGPVQSESNPTWSEMNQLIVAENEGIQIYDIKNNSLTPIKRIDTQTPNVIDIYASPDGKYLAFAPIGNQAIYLFSSSNSSSEVLYEGENVSIVGWLKIP